MRRSGGKNSSDGWSKVKVLDSVEQSYMNKYILMQDHT